MTVPTISRTPRVTSRVTWVKPENITPHTVTVTTADTPYGTFVTASTDMILLAAALLAAAQDVHAFTQSCHQHYPHAPVVTTSSDEWQKQIFSPSAPLLVRTPDTPFRQAVHTALSTIPYGSVVSYQDVAVMIGQSRATRAVASAIAANTVAVAIPCHRVWRSNGMPGEFRWGTDVKRRLCADEQAHPS